MSKEAMKLALEAGFNLEQGFLLRVTGIDEDLERFAELVRADEREQGQRWFDAVTAQHKQAILAEREACAMLCEAEWSTVSEQQHGYDLASAIRARSNT